MRPGTVVKPTGVVRFMWVCRDCSTLVERPAGSTGTVLCEKHRDKP